MENFDENKDREERRRQRKQKQKQQQLKTRRTIIIVLSVLIVILLIVMVCACNRSKKNNGGTENSTQSSTSAQNSSTPDSQQNVSEPSTVQKPAPLPTATTTNPLADDDGQSVGQMEGSVYVWNQQAFELFYGDPDMAQPYAEFINKASEKLASDGIKTFSIIVPNHVEFGLPERLKNTDEGVTTLSQAEYISAAYGSMNPEFTAPINVYDKLSEHNNEYIYFNSDHHWTGLGAYYAYTAFAEQTGLTPLSLADCTEQSIDGFTGSLTNIAESQLKEDSVHYWQFPYAVSNTIHTTDGTTYELDSCYSEVAESYGVFLEGDNPLEVIKSESPAATSGKVAIVHESYGNAFTPYLTYNFSEVYSIDFRSWEGNLGEFCKENGISNVIFLNGVMSSATQMQIDSMESII